MGQAGDQGSKGDEEYGRKEHVGAADWTRARGGGEQLIPIQGTVVIDLLETFGTKQTSDSQRQEEPSQDKSSHIPVQDTRMSTSSSFKAQPWHPVMGFATIPVPPSRFPGPYSNSPGHLPRAQHTVRKRFHSLVAFVGFLQHYSTIPSKAALLATCFTHLLPGVGGVGGAVGAASEAGGDVFRGVSPAHGVEDLLRALASNPCLNLLLGIGCTARKEGGEIGKK